ncbi:MAG: hypothetical protein JGK24_17130 [Microcoleus sp. PH2017_29_MFU_D_A]|uniref:hypothetical protein n=1 Tax=unclassified Microcoleus TaxID=2642155 RepID=UPI001D26A13E|nr:MULTISPECIES: hypothetical protein [unclassified Microcoleus]MCC3464526.1 hypothetical protein [Microcoleus sp. PH2017_06_SFM_O_A]MCC3503025.1 hypothetical protein [Microcoleus sp. PH2017_19_SFW_U_A]MCC3513626.1 hypothetical protein [Microcoleus sp. PH2017_17_BER_D_A]TAE15478.1 MAG: hypothetical protein EAZ94_04270 [Oscillatoriales cyanobacterium]MCC3410569.1 hypothetical protein [Microcoleus sp. PH2017_02_FOX_O_A]
MAAGSQPVYGQFDSASGGYTAIGGPQLQSYQVIGTVTAGPPIITDPKTGKPYPPNYVPDEQAPGTHEMWTPGSSLAEAKKLQVARLQEFTRSAIESAVRPLEEKLVGQLEKGVDQYGQAVQNLGSQFGKDPGKAVSNLLGGGAAQLAGGATKIGSQAIQSGQQLAGQALKSGQQLAGQVSASFGGGTPQAKFNSGSGGGMTSALVSKAPERALTGGTGPVFTSGARRN